MNQGINSFKANTQIPITQAEFPILGGKIEKKQYLILDLTQDFQRKLLSKINTYYGFYGKLHALSVDEGKWTGQDIDKACFYIQEWHLISLNCFRNFSKMILHQIIHIKFTHLKEAYFSENEIQSIENLSLIFLPFLTILSLNQNKIFCTRTLRKASWPHLEDLTLSSNHINQLSSLDSFNSPKLRLLDVSDLNKANYHEKRCYLKQNSRNLRQINFYTPNIFNHIPQETIYQSLKKKWPELFLVKTRKDHHEFFKRRFGFD